MGQVFTIFDTKFNLGNPQMKVIAEASAKPIPMPPHLRPYGFNQVCASSAFAVLECQKMIYAEMPISIFGHVQITLEAVGVHG